MQIGARRPLERLQAELRQKGEHAVGKCALERFVGNPFEVAREAVELQRHAFGRGLERAYHQHQVAAHVGAVAQVIREILPQRLQVDDFLRCIGRKIPLFAEPRRLFRRAPVNRAGVDEDRALDASSAAFAHAPPVLERVADQRIGRNRRNRLVEILHLDRRQRHLDYIPVGTVFTHRYPVSRSQHVVGRELNAGDEPQYAVLENQHQHGGRCTQSGQNARGVPVDENPDDQHDADADGHEFEHLVDAFQRPVAQRFVFVRNVVERAEKGV